MERCVRQAAKTAHTLTACLNFPLASSFPFFRAPIMTLSDDAFDLIFRQARTHNTWQPKPVDDALLARLVELALLGPTSANCSPVRLVFVKTADGKERLRPALAEGNVKKTMAAPVTMIVGMDMAFYDQLPKL